MENKIKEYIYFDDNGDAIYSSSKPFSVIYSSSGEPLEYEDQTPCVCLEFHSETDKNMVLDAIFPKD